MSELSKCPLCESNSEPCIDKLDWGGYYAVCNNCSGHNGCGFRLGDLHTEEAAIQSWNSLCEDIRVGREARAACLAQDRELIGTWNYHCGRDEVWFATRPIPAPLTMEEVLRECRDFVIQTIGSSGATDEERVQLRDKIDAVLPPEETS